MGRNRIAKGFKDILGPGEPIPQKDGGFNQQSISRADPAVFRELKAAVSKVESRAGIDLPQGNLGFTDDNRDFLGVHFGEGDRRTVLLKREFFNRRASEIITDIRRSQSSKWIVPSNSPLQYVMVHELGHSIWVSSVEGRRAELASLNKSIRSLYRQFRKDGLRGRTPISRYAETNIDEFFAETFAKAIIGRGQNRYSRRLLALIKKNRSLLNNIR